MTELAYWELAAYGIAFQSAMHLYNVSKTWPLEESASLTGPLRRSSRAVCTHIAIAWKKRHDQNAFTESLRDAVAQAAETLVWLNFAFACKHLAEKDHTQLYINYDDIDRFLTKMILEPEKWCDH